MERTLEIGRMVVKAGTGLVTNQYGLDTDFIADITRQCATTRINNGTEIVIVSSGAIAAGRQRIPDLGSAIVDRQVAAIYGQNQMAGAWISEFAKCGILAGAPVYTDRDLPNAKYPLRRALQHMVVIPNGHDAVYDPQTERQIITADNDNLACKIGIEIEADFLAILTNIQDGVLDAQGRVIRRFRYDEDIEIMQAGKSDRGTGGMETKIEAARLFVATTRKTAVIAGGRIPDVLLRILNREEIGTWVVHN